MNTHYYWLAVNGPSVAINTMPWSFEDVAEATVVPKPEWLIGFPTLDEAVEVQQFMLNAPIPAIIREQRVWQRRKDVKVIVNPDAEPPTRGQTMWIFERDSTCAESA